MRMDTPGITPWIYGWHTDKSAGIPKSKFIQLWAPFTGRVEKNLGGLNVIKDSHKKKVKTEDDAIVRKLILSGEHARPRLDNKVIGANNKNEEIELFCEWGEGIFFNSNLMHKSGINKSTDRIRYVFTCFYFMGKYNLSFPNWTFKEILAEPNSFIKVCYYNSVIRMLIGYLFYVYIFFFILEIISPELFLILPLPR